MKRILLYLGILLLFAPIYSSAERSPNYEEFWSKLAEDLTELQSLNVEFRMQTENISPQFMMPDGLQQLKTGDREKIQKIMAKMLDWIKVFIKEYERFPINIEGFSVGFPSGATIDFSIDLVKIGGYLPPD